MESFSKNIFKSVKIWQKYGHRSVAPVFRRTLYIYYKYIWKITASANQWRFLAVRMEEQRSCDEICHRVEIRALTRLLKAIDQLAWRTQASAVAEGPARRAASAPQFTLEDIILDFITSTKRMSGSVAEWLAQKGPDSNRSRQVWHSWK